MHPEKFLRIGPAVNRHSVYTEPKDDDAAWRGQNNQRAIKRLQHCSEKHEFRCDACLQ